MWLLISTPVIIERRKKEDCLQDAVGRTDITYSAKTLTPGCARTVFEMGMEVGPLNSRL